MSDASTPDQPLLDKRYYVDPGVLWWAFDPASAHQRGTQGEKDFGRRVAAAEREMEEAGRFDHVVVNDDLERVVEEVAGILGSTPPTSTSHNGSSA